MRLHSSPDSFSDGKATVLAMAETVAAILLYLAISVRFQTVVHMVVPIALAPLFLLRTPQSVEWALNLYHFLAEKIILNRTPSLSLPLALYALILAPLLLVLTAFAVRLASTLFWLVRKPWQTLKAIPTNWYRQTFCLDSYHAPELLPGEIQRKSQDSESISLLTDLFEALRSEESPFLRHVFTIFFGAPIAFSYILVFIYRWTFKATSIVYFPLVWITHASLNNLRTTATWLQRVKDSEIEKARRAVALASLPLIGLKIGVYSGALTIEEALEKFVGKDIGTVLLNASAWPLWGTGIIVEFALTFVLFFFADAAIARNATAYAWPERRTRLTLEILILARSTVAVLLFLHVVSFAVSRLAGMIAA